MPITDPSPLPPFNRETARKNSRATPNPETRARQSPEGITSLGQNLVIKGELSAAEHIIIDGSFEGKIHVPNHGLAVGRPAQVKADVFAGSVNVLGSVTGNLTASELIEVRDTATVKGCLATSRLIIVEGAQFNGTVKALPRADSSKETPVDKTNKTLNLQSTIKRPTNT